MHYTFNRFTFYGTPFPGPLAGYFLQVMQQGVHAT